MAAETSRPKVQEVNPTGPALAASLSAVLGLLGLSLAFVVAELDKGFKGAMQSLGMWMPEPRAIGPLSGKFTFMVLVWFGSWALLHTAMRRREVDLRKWFYVLVIGVAAGVLLLWPPVVESLHGG
ncbi:MAG: hypothetical protein HY558_02065 [Euryarchaeota archaeon]|nr:hypothetical protein [Euryarchaeota archaeon]